MNRKNFPTASICTAILTVIVTWTCVVVAKVSMADDAVNLVAVGDNQANSAEVRTGRFVFKAEPRRSLTVFYPDDWTKSDQRPALMIFRCNIPKQREFFRSLGMVVIEPELAAVNHGLIPGATLQEIARMPKPRHQVEDTKSAIRYVRKNAGKLGVNPEQIVATGTSGGGDLALQSFLNRSFEDPNDDLEISPRPNALVLYCPAFDGIDIWFVRMDALLERTKTEAPAFLPLLDQFVRNPGDEYAVPLNHRADLIELAELLGREQGIDERQIRAFQSVLQLFNKSDWQLLQPVEDELKMCASRLLTDEAFPPTLIMLGDRDHLFRYQTAFVNKARSAGKQFELKRFKDGGHSFMIQPAFLEPSNQVVNQFLRKLKYLPLETASD